MNAKTGSAIAGEALERIGALYAIERETPASSPMSDGDGDSDRADPDRWPRS